MTRNFLDPIPRGAARRSAWRATWVALMAMLGTLPLSTAAAPAAVSVPLLATTDEVPMPAAETFVDPRELVALGGRLLFNAYHPALGQTLWALDAERATVEQLIDVRPGFRGSAPSGLTVFDGQVYFTADDGRSGFEFWRSDGTRAGTRLVKDIAAGPEASVPAFLTVYRGALYFAASAAPKDLQGHRLWRSGGDAATTQPVRGAEALANPRQLTVAGDKLYFTATDPAHGQELWVLGW
jgi:ELWxxDGT repeat protein